MISRRRLIFVSALLLLSTITCGFSAFVISENSAKTVSIGTSVADVTIKGTSASCLSYSSFTMNQYGFAHEESAYNVTYYDYSYTLESIWMIPDSGTFTYALKQNDTDNFYNYINSKGSFTVSSYTSYTNGTLGGTETTLSGGTIDADSASISFTSSPTQYVLFSYTRTLVSGTDFAANSFINEVYNKSIDVDIHNNKYDVSFTMELKLG